MFNYLFFYFTIRALKFAHESLNCITGWTSSLLAPPPLQGGARPLKGGACPPLNQARGGLPPP